MAIEDYYTEMATRVTLTTAAWGSTGTRTTQAKFEAAINTTPRESFSGDKKTVFYDAKFYCRPSEEINHDDIIVINGVDYSILSVKNTFGLNHHKRVILKRP